MSFLSYNISSRNPSKSISGITRSLKNPTTSALRKSHNPATFKKVLNLYDEETKVSEKTKDDCSISSCYFQAKTTKKKQSKKKPSSKLTKAYDLTLSKQSSNTSSMTQGRSQKAQFMKLVQKIWTEDEVLPETNDKPNKFWRIATSRTNLDIIEITPLDSMKNIEFISDGQSKAKVTKTKTRPSKYKVDRLTSWLESANRILSLSRERSISNRVLSNKSETMDKPNVRNISKHYYLSELESKRNSISNTIDNNLIPLMIKKSSFWSQKMEPKPKMMNWNLYSSNTSFNLKDSPIKNLKGTTMKHSQSKGKIFFPFDNHKKSVNNDADELMDFVELEDLCRRSTAHKTSITKSADCSIRSTMGNTAIKNMKEMYSSTIPKNSAKSKNCKKPADKKPLVKTMSITICKDSRIIYGK